MSPLRFQDPGSAIAMPSSTGYRHLVCLAASACLLLCSLFAGHAAAGETGRMDQFLSDYGALKQRVEAVTDQIRQARKQDEAIDPAEIRLVRKSISDLIKKAKKYNLEQRRAENRGRSVYADREQVLKLLYACDEMQRMLEAEMRANDLMTLALKHEEQWKQTDAALGNRNVSE